MPGARAGLVAPDDITFASGRTRTKPVKFAQVDLQILSKQLNTSDLARAASLLESKGYRISESIMFQRFVRLVDEAKRNEFHFALR